MEEMGVASFQGSHLNYPISTQKRTFPTADSHPCRREETPQQKHSDSRRLVGVADSRQSKANKYAGFQEIAGVEKISWVNAENI